MASRIDTGLGKRSLIVGRIAWLLVVEDSVLFSVILHISTITIVVHVTTWRRSVGGQDVCAWFCGFLWCFCSLMLCVITV